MKTIEIDEAVYDALLAKILDFGDTPNQVLRRELGIGKEDAPEIDPEQSPLQKFLASTEFQFAKGAVGRFLLILSWLYKRDQSAFAAVEEIRGRGRIYFSKNLRDLEEAGRSVNPKQIPDSPYWVITTTPTDLKQQMIENVMKALKYDGRSIQLARTAIAG